MSAHVAIHHGQERKLVDRFVAEKAISADTARVLEPKPGTDRAAWRRLERRGLIRQAGRGRFYLDRRRLEEVRQLQRVIIFAAVAIAAIGLIVQLALSRS